MPAGGETLYIANLNRLNRELRSMGKEWDQELRDESGVIASDLAARVVRKAGAVGYPQDTRVAPTLRAKRGNRPQLAWGGSRRVVSGGATASQLVYGVEFGGNSWRFPKPHAGQPGYYLYPTIRSEGQAIANAYLDAVERVWDRAARAVA